jgi:hypothetical protein
MSLGETRVRLGLHERTSIRERFAASALTGILAGHTGDTIFPDAAYAAQQAQEYADALLRRLDAIPAPLKHPD